MKTRKAISMAHVAKKAGVTPSAVSYILSGKKLACFADTTIAKVQRAAEELGYRIRKDHRRFQRKQLDIRVQIELRDKESQEIISRGTAILDDISDEGFLLNQIELKSKQLPLVPFIVEVIVPESGLEDFRIKGEPVRFREGKHGMELGFTRLGIEDKHYQLLKQLV